jgi:hypothetical protein
MQKNKEISHSVIPTIAISTIFIASFMLSGSQFSQAFAIHEGTGTTATAQSQLTGGNATTTSPTNQSQASASNTTAASTPTTDATTDTTTQTQTVPGGNATGAGATSAPAPTAATQEPPVNQNFVRQGTVASGQDPLPGHESHELAFVLPPRSDGGVYSGVLTYTASKPVEVVVLHNYDPQNSTAIPEEYGTELTSPLPGGGGNIAITLFKPPYDAGINAASVPFTGNGLALHMLEDDPFTATYTVNAFATQPENANAPLEFTSAEGQVEEGEAGAEEEEEAGAGGGDEEEEAGADEEEEAGADEEEDAPEGDNTGVPGI